MIIEHRDRSLKYPKAIHDQKIRLVLDWLLEFRFSSIGILARRIESNKINSNRFFNRLISDGIIQIFSNVQTNNNSYVMLTLMGLSYLEAYGRDVSRGVTGKHLLGKYSQILHDIAVQEAVISRLNSYEEVVWDKHIDLEKLEKPDAILKSPKGYWVALDYERWRKDKKRIFMQFVNHADCIKERLYKAVIYLFDKEVDCAYYKNVFNEETWPKYFKESKTGRIRPLESHFKPNEVKNLRDVFVFSHEPVSKKS